MVSLQKNMYLQCLSEMWSSFWRYGQDRHYKNTLLFLKMDDCHSILVKKIIIIIWRCLLPCTNQSWIFIGKNDAEVGTSILWPLGEKNWLIRKDPDAGKDRGQKEKGTTENVMVGWHHRLDGHEFEQALGVSDGQGSLACCSPWGRKELDTTERLNWTKLNYIQWPW